MADKPSELTHPNKRYLLFRDPFFLGALVEVAGFCLIGLDLIVSPLFLSRYSAFKAPILPLLLECGLLSVGLLGVVHAISRGGRMSDTLQKKTDFSGKNVIITGGTAGIGKACAIQMLKWNARVFLCCRDPKKTEKALRDILQESGAPKDKLKSFTLHLDDLKSVKECADALLNEKVDFHILMNNAGVMMCPLSLTKQGLENQFGVNHMAHMYLTLLLLPNIKKAEGRIINVSSIAHLWAPADKKTGLPFTFNEVVGTEQAQYDPTRYYGISKLSNIYFTQQLQKRELTGTKAGAYVLHPGGVYTELNRHSGGPIMNLIFNAAFKSPIQGAQSQLYLAAAPANEIVPAAYYADCVLTPTSEEVHHREASAALWDESMKFLKEKMGYVHPQ